MKLKNEHNLHMWFFNSNCPYFHSSYVIWSCIFFWAGCTLPCNVRSFGKTVSFLFVGKSKGISIRWDISPSYPEKWQCSDMLKGKRVFWFWLGPGVTIYFWNALFSIFCKKKYISWLLINCQSLTIIAVLVKKISEEGRFKFLVGIFSCFVYGNE